MHKNKLKLDLNVRYKTIKLLEENTGSTLFGVDLMVSLLLSFNSFSDIFSHFPNWYSLEDHGEIDTQTTLCVRFIMRILNLGDKM